MSRARLTLVVSLVAVVALPWSAVGEEERAKASVAPAWKYEDRACAPDQRTVLQSRAPRALGAGGEVAAAQAYLLLHVEFNTTKDAEAFNVEGARVITQHAQFIDLFVDTAQWPNGAVVEKIFTSPGFRWLDVDVAVGRPPAPRILAEEATARGPAEPILRDGFRDARGHLRGKGVVIAVVDDGVDFRHPDFIRYDAGGVPTSRFLYIWDLSDQIEVTAALREKGVSEGPIKYPNGHSVGTVYSQKALTAALRRKLGVRLPETHAGTHGTRCAGIAAGNGNAWATWWDEAKASGRYKMRMLPGRRERVGVAPEADLIGIKIAKDASGGMPYGGFLPAIVEWVEKVVGDRPLVVSCSFGGHSGGHDGSQVDERHLDARFDPNRPGRVICIAAGNEGDAGIHARVSFGAEEGKLSWKTRETPGSVSIRVYVDDAMRREDLAVYLGDGTQGVVVGGPFQHQISGRSFFTLNAPAKDGSVYLATDSGKEFKADAYISARDNQGRGLFVQFENAAASYMVGTPGTMTNAITVGSYDWNSTFWCKGGTALVDNRLQIGGISSYSSPGPRRDGLVKPEVVSPGQWYMAALPLRPQTKVSVPDCDTWQGRQQRREETPYPSDISGKYQLMNGTSAATPYAAGVIALMLERNPKLTVEQIKKVFAKYANKLPMENDGLTNAWGGGKLDKPAIGQMFAEISGN